MRMCLKIRTLIMRLSCHKYALHVLGIQSAAQQRPLPSLPRSYFLIDNLVTTTLSQPYPRNDINDHWWACTPDNLQSWIPRFFFICQLIQIEDCAVFLLMLVPSTLVAHPCTLSVRMHVIRMTMVHMRVVDQITTSLPGSLVLIHPLQRPL